jgi:hypothetical protein
MKKRKLVLLVVFFALVSLNVSCGRSISDHMIKINSAKSQAPDKICNIVFYRPSSLGFKVLPVILTADGKYLGEAISKGQFTVQLPAGSYTFIAWGEGTFSMKANLKAGKTYYVKVLTHFGAWSARFHLIPVKPGSEESKTMEKELALCDPFSVNQEAGQKSKIDARLNDAKEVIRKGKERYESYSDKEKEERTMNPDDGM